MVVSDREFPANVYPWLRLREAGVEVELIPTTVEGWPDEARMLERLEDPRVRAVAVSLVQFSNGYCADLAALSAATRRTGAYLVVDAIQAVGQFPVDLRAHAGGRSGLRRPEVAALPVGIRVRVRAARAHRES